MKIEGALFTFLFAFLAVTTVIYGILSEDWTGTTAMALSAALAGMVGYYLWFTARRMEARPEDRPDAEISEGSGEVGFFAPHSWWPIAMAGSASVLGLGLVFGPWIGLIGLGFILVSVFGFLFEYYVGINRSQGQTLGALQAMGERPTSVHKFLGD